MIKSNKKVNCSNIEQMSIKVANSHDIIIHLMDEKRTWIEYRLSHPLNQISRYAITLIYIA